MKTKVKESNLLDMKAGMRMVGLLAAVAVVLAGCSSTYVMRKQLERVAKDWSLVIRASQVIPVYPLTEDLRPGDMFLVQTLITNQVKVYETKGYLPLDNHLARLHSDQYGVFYRDGFGVTNGSGVPYVWSTPWDNTNQWKHGPGAAFPSYSFEFRRGAGLAAALPIQGIPVGLSLLGADSGQGSVTISEAFTYGLSEELLRDPVYEWALLNREFLKHYEPERKATNYLRVVNRVYLASEMNVFIAKAASVTISASAGAAKEVNLFANDSTNAASNYTNLLGKINDNIATASLPGGTLKVAAATSRTISLKERFHRPLVVGYLAIEYPILTDGELGPPVPTFSRLANQPFIKSKGKLVVIQHDTQDPNTQVVLKWLAKHDEQGNPVNRAKLIEWLAKERESPISKSLIPEVATAPKYRELRKAIVKELIKKE